MTAQLRIRLVFIELQTVVFVVIDVGGLLKKSLDNSIKKEPQLEVRNLYSESLLNLKCNEEMKV